MATKKADAPSPQQIRRTAFESSLNACRTEIANALEAWIKSGRSNDGKNELAASCSLALPAGGPEREFEREADAAMADLMRDYRNAGWNTKVSFSAQDRNLLVTFLISDE